ncbi:hypothetical protein MMC26_003046 [Xylographa opegraphella]|nr:hypothetical protein [Xylographa opegraphella]
MAAGNNWKRPWEDKIDENHGFSSVAAPETDRLPIPHLQQVPTRFELETRLQRSGETTPLSQDNSESMSGSSSKHNLSPISRDQQRRGKWPKHRGSLSNPPGQKCSKYPVGNDASFTDLSAPAPIPSVLASQFEGTLGNRDDQRNRRGRASAPDFTFGCDDRKSFSEIAPELMNPSSTHDTHNRQASLDNLHGDLSMIWKGVGSDQHEVLTLESSRTSTRPLPQDPLDQVLEWAVQRLDSSIHLLKETLVPRTPFPPNIPDAMIYGEGDAGKSIARVHLRDKWEWRGRLDLPMNKPFNQQPEIARPPKVNAPRPLPLPEGERRRSIAGEYGFSQLPYSPSSTAPSVGSHLSFLQSPMQAPTSNRPLLSPSSLNFSGSQTLPPLSPSLMGSKSPHTAHLQELQHQLSTKSLAHQILQSEHDKLLAAYSRSQTRCATLDKKSQVSDNEINNLMEDRIRLQAQVDALEAQVDELQQGKEEAQKQSVASGSQYLQIMGMSSRLQAQAAGDLKKWKTDRDDWQKEKEYLLQKIANLEADARGIRSAPALIPPGFVSSRQSPGPASLEATKTDIDSADVLMSNSIEVLRAEIARLRKGSREAESSLHCWRTDSLQLEEILGKLNIVGNRMRARAIDTADRHHQHQDGYFDGVRGE